VTHLGDPLALPCGATLPNRFLKSAMSETLARTDGLPHEGHRRLYAAFAAGGTGCVVTGNVMIDRTALGEPGNVVLEEGTDLEPFRAWASVARASLPGQLWVQLNHPGKQSPIHLNPQPVAPSAIPLGHGLERVFRPPRALTGEEIAALVARFAASARLVKEAGFAGVQIHGAHGYLVSQFLSPRHNQREDDWGGTPEKRRRFVLDVYRAMRAAVGDGFPVGIKLNSADFQKGGLDEAESVGVFTALADAGIDLVEISGGTYEAPAMTGAKVKRSTAEREAYFLAFAERLRNAVSVPICVTGGFRTARAMRAAVESGATDLVGLARPIAVDPDLPKKVLAGEDYVSPAVNEPTTGIRAVDRVAVLAVSWYEQQLARIASGKPPNPTMSAWTAVFGSAWHHGTAAFKPRRV
jgi:2,4-dienoyl-CoA reductase-like NADH-dependent reductase (Old Yellow Enzyme family)